MIATLEYFRHYIDGQPVHLDTDHQNITWLSRLRGRSDRLGIWVLRLSEFNATIKWRKSIHMPLRAAMSHPSRHNHYMCCVCRARRPPHRAALPPSRRHRHTTTARRAAPRATSSARGVVARGGAHRSWGRGPVFCVVGPSRAPAAAAPVPSNSRARHGISDDV